MSVRAATALAVLVVLIIGGCGDDDSGSGDAAEVPDQSTADVGSTPEDADTITTGGSTSKTGFDPDDPVTGRVSPLIEGLPVVDEHNAVFDLCGDEPQRVDLHPVAVTADGLEADGYSTRGTPTDLAVAEDFGTEDGSWIRVVKFEDGTWLRVAAVTCAR